MDLDLESPSARLAWEDPGFQGGLAAKVLATLRVLLRSPEQAGQALGGNGKIGSAIGFYALCGLPCQWVASAFVQSANLAHPDRMAWVFRWFHLPEPAAPTAQQLAVQKVMGWAQLAAFPLLAALGILLMGALAHGGLWMARGLSKNKGIESTYRTLLYLAGALSWVGLINAAGAYLPGGFFWAHQAFSLALGLGLFTYQGMVLAEVHQIERWRGVLGVFLPGVALCLLCLCCATLIAVGAAALVQSKV